MMFGKCSHGHGTVNLVCQAVGVLIRIWQELQSVNGRLHRVERYLAAHAPGYPLAPPNGHEADQLAAAGVSPLPGEDALAGNA